MASMVEELPLSVFMTAKSEKILVLQPNSSRNAATAPYFIDKNRYYTLILAKRPRRHYTLILAKRPRSDKHFFSNFCSLTQTYLSIEVAKDIHSNSNNIIF